MSSSFLYNPPASLVPAFTDKETYSFHRTYGTPDAYLGNTEQLHQSFSVNFWLFSNGSKNSTGIISEIVSICPHKNLKVAVYTFTSRLFSFT